MSRTPSRFRIDDKKFTEAIESVMAINGYKSWQEVSRFTGYSEGALGQMKRSGTVSSRMAKILELTYGIKREDYELVDEGIFAQQESEEQPEERADTLSNIEEKLERSYQGGDLIVYEGIKNALNDPQIRNTLRGIIASGIVAALEAQKGARE